MVFAYVRVSSDKQTNENQRHEIMKLAERRGLTIESFTEETVSGTVKVDDRKLRNVIHTLRKGDILLITEMSRLGRTLIMVLQVLQECMDKEALVITAKDGFELGNNITSKVLAFAFGLASEIERNLISQRTKEALARRRAEGQILGRPKGKKTALKKLDNSDKLRDIHRLLQSKVSVSAIARLLKIHRMTITLYINRYDLRNPSAKIPAFEKPVPPPEPIVLAHIPDRTVEAPPLPVQPVAPGAPITSIKMFRHKKKYAVQPAR